MTNEDDGPWYITSERTHAHDCPHCGGTWLHQNDECEVMPYDFWKTDMTCPECDQ